jgi:hypothetical protein
MFISLNDAWARRPIPSSVGQCHNSLGTENRQGRNMVAAAVAARRGGNVRFVALDLQHARVERELKEAFARLPGSSAFTLGAEVDAFEAEFAEYSQARHCVGVASGTAGDPMEFHTAIARSVVRIVEAADRSLRAGGGEVPLDHADISGQLAARRELVATG